MPRSREKELQAVEEARRHFMEGAILFAKANHVDLESVLTEPKNVVIEFRYSQESHLGIPPDVADFTKSVYGRPIEIRSIVANWFFTGSRQNENPRMHTSMVDILVRLPRDCEGVSSNGLIMVPNKECYVSPAIRIDIDHTPFEYVVRQQTLPDLLKQDGSFPSFVSDTLRPSVIVAIGDILGGLQGRKRLGQRVKEVAARRFFPELFTTIKSPLRRISISDPEE